MRMFKSALLALLLLSTGFAQAQPAPENITLPDVVLDTFILRPFGLVFTIVGTAIFIGTSPLTALANIAPPHHAFEHSARVFIEAPFDYTFKRPFGVLFGAPLYRGPAPYYYPYPPPAYVVPKPPAAHYPPPPPPPPPPTGATPPR